MNFSLSPFSTEDSPQIQIRGEVQRRKNIFSVSYVVRGDVREVVFPARLTTPTRKDDLWQTTCFEFFLSVKGLPHYWEFNLSPSGEWNIYAMDSYRQVNMREEVRIQGLRFNVQKDANYFSLESELDLSPIIEEKQRIEAGIASVIQTDSQSISYWALTHPHLVADFHVRNSFILEFA